MNELHRAAEQALEALENVYGKGKRCEAAIQALRQALAEPTYEFECPRCGHCCQQREWVGLTDDEWYEATSIPRNATLPIHMLKGIEAKLKEKNA